MKKTNSEQIPRRGRIFPEIQWSESEKAQKIAEREAFYQRCRVVFETINVKLMIKHYGWYVAIEPESGDYFLDSDAEIASFQARQQYPHRIHCLFCLNETGACGTI
ncbi:MAG: hypothetical protein AB4058_21515 [Microcystaceae cyanobacterium]